MSHQRTVYLIDPGHESRRTTARHLAAIGAEAWPFPSGAEFLEIFDHLMPACILLDMDMEEPSGLELLRLLATRQAPWPVIAISGRGDVALAVEAMKLGAQDFLEKPAAPAALSAALILAWAALARSIAAAETQRAAHEKVSRLTPREIDIALALLSGRANKGVAHDLGISVRTVEMHRSHIMAKLGVKSLAEAAVLATQAGLLMPPPCGAPPESRPLPGTPGAVPPGASRRDGDTLLRRAS
jgi:FixJ family two-component response regulator